MRRDRLIAVVAALFATFFVLSPASAATTERSVFYSYDMAGRQLSAKFDNAAGGTHGEGITNTYDGFGDLVSSQVSVWDPATSTQFTKTLTSAYDGAGRRTQVTHPDAQAFTYAYDALSRLSGIYQGVGTASPLDTFTYGTNGLVASRAETGGSSVGYSWDDIGRLLTQGDAFAGGTGNVNWTLGYNPASQIGTETRDNNSYAWTGAVNVNRPYAVNGLNQYTSAGSASFTYDANGNLITDGTWTYTYDVENRLIKAVDGSTTVNLTYDPLGRLFQVDKGTTATTTKFVYDGDAQVLEYNSSGTVTNRYVHGSNLAADDPLVWYAGSTLGTLRYLHADHLGSIASIASSTGANYAIDTYDEYGINGAANNTAERFGYTGQAYIPELGLYYYKARFYSPSLGRFLQTDPIGYKGGINIYEYATDDPVDLEDPSGELAGSSAAEIENALRIAAGEEVVGGGPEDPFADLAAGITIGIGIYNAYEASGDADRARASRTDAAEGRNRSTSPVQGRAQVTYQQGQRSGHAFRSLREAYEMAHSGRYESVHLNQAIRTITNGAVDSSLRPDVAGVRRDGKIDVVEVASSRQNPTELIKKYQNALGSRAGTITVTRATRDVCTGSRIPGAAC